jgi:hypothetical protein
MFFMIKFVLKGSRVNNFKISSFDINFPFTDVQVLVQSRYVLIAVVILFFIYSARRDIYIFV